MSQICGGVIAVLWPLLQAAAQDPIYLRRETGALDGPGVRFLFQDRVQSLDPGVRAEGAPPRHHLIEHRAQREDVRAAVRPFPANLLRAHVAYRPGDCPDLRGCRAFGRSILRRLGESAALDVLDEAEVEDPGGAVSGED